LCVPSGCPHLADALVADPRSHWFPPGAVGQACFGSGSRHDLVLPRGSGPRLLSSPIPEPFGVAVVAPGFPGQTWDRSRRSGTARIPVFLVVTQQKCRPEPRGTSPARASPDENAWVPLKHVSPTWGGVIRKYSVAEVLLQDLGRRRTPRAPTGILGGRSGSFGDGAFFARALARGYGCLSHDDAPRSSRSWRTARSRSRYGTGPSRCSVSTGLSGARSLDHPSTPRTYPIGTRRGRPVSRAPCSQWFRWHHPARGVVHVG